MDSSALTIIGTPISHYVQTVILTCEEKGATYRLQIDGHDTPVALKSPEHLQWHPFARIPAMAIGKIKLYEASAICRYVDQVFDGPSLVPDNPLEAARMEQWISAMNCYFHTPCISHLVGQYVFPRGPGGQPDKQVIESALPKIMTALEQLALGYEQYNYLASEQISLADLFIAPILMQMGQTPEGNDCLSGFSIIQEKISRIYRRPSFEKMRRLYTDNLPKNHRLTI